MITISRESPQSFHHETYAPIMSFWVLLSISLTFCTELRVKFRTLGSPFKLKESLIREFTGFLASNFSTLIDGVFPKNIFLWRASLSLAFKFISAASAKLSLERTIDPLIVDTRSSDAAIRGLNQFIPRFLII